MQGKMCQILCQNVSNLCQIWGWVFSDYSLCDGVTITSYEIIKKAVALSKLCPHVAAVSGKNRKNIKKASVLLPVYELKGFRLGILFCIDYYIK